MPCSGPCSRKHHHALPLSQVCPHIPVDCDYFFHTAYCSWRPGRSFLDFFKPIKPWWCIHPLKKLINIVKNEKSTSDSNIDKKIGSASPQKERWPRRCRPRQSRIQPTLATLWSPPWRHCGQFLKKHDQQHMTRGFQKKILFQTRRKVPTRHSDLQKNYSSTPKINLHLGASATAEGCFFPSGATTATAHSAG